MMIYRDGEQQIQRDAILESVSTSLRAMAELELEAAEQRAMCQMRRRVTFTVWMSKGRKARSAIYSVEAA